MTVNSRLDTEALRPTATPLIRALALQALGRAPIIRGSRFGEVPFMNT
jgi:hypothetical protein